MSQRDSGYERKERDCYETPEWVTEALLPYLPQMLKVWEPAAGSGKMARVLERRYRSVYQTDIERGVDFLTSKTGPGFVEAIITNPPYDQAAKFIEHALNLVNPIGLVAMLLRTDFDHAKTRQHLFGQCKVFAKKIVLTKRIKWFEDSTGQPSFNHAWFIWDYEHEGPPALAYGP
jgi:hypothetical protein